MKVLFLDIDGVLNSASGAARIFENPLREVNSRFIEYQLVEALINIVSENECKIVISSTWRMLDIDYRDYFPKCLVDRIIGATPRINMDVSSGGGRGSEIKLWLKEHPEANRFCILDDDSFDITNHEDLVDHFVHVDGDCGLVSGVYDGRVRAAFAKIL